MSEPDLYAALNLERTAEHIEIVRAYRRLMRKYHPDTRTSNAGRDSHKAEDRRLQLIMEAYSVLADPVRRAEYDRRIQRRRGIPQDAVQPPVYDSDVPDPAASIWFYYPPSDDVTWLFPPASLRYERARSQGGWVFRWLQR